MKGDPESFAEFSHFGGDFRIVIARHGRTEVVLDLEVQVPRRDGAEKIAFLPCCSAATKNFFLSPDFM